MSTGLESWNTNLLDVGPLYPFAGTEMLWALIGIATWVVWHLIQIRAENKVYDEDEKEFSDGKRLREAMRDSNAQTLMEGLDAHRLHNK
jgi:hypothetical protein